MRLILCFANKLLRQSLAVLLAAFLCHGVVYAWACIDCGSRCCSDTFLGRVCEPSCSATCAAANLGCGQVEVPSPVPGAPPVVVAKIDPAVGAAILTGGLVNPVSQKATSDAILNVTKAVQDVAANVAKAAKDTEAEVARAGRSIETAAQALAEYEKAVLTGQKKSIDQSLEKLREGKVVDALWRQAVDPLRNKSDAAAAASMKSDVLRTVGQLGASVYGGPGGAAAYAAWLAYYQSGGDLNVALRAGIITGAASYAMGAANKISTVDAAGDLVMTQAVKKAVVVGAIGGLSVAAAGGNESAVRDGFLRAGAMIVIQEGFREYTGHELTEESRPGRSSILKAPKGPAYCVSSVVECRQPPPGAAKFVNGKFVGWDQSKLDPTAPHVGTSFPSDPAAPPTQFTWPKWTGEGGGVMKVIGSTPGANAMGVFHDQWAVNWNMPPVVLEASIYPAIVLTYNGTSAPLFEQIRDQAVASGKEVASIAPSSDKAQRAIDAVLRNTDTPAADATGLPVPIRESQVDATFMCASANSQRMIAVEIDEQRRAFACRVLYRAKDQVTVPWRAEHEVNYCTSKAVQLAKVQLKAGYRCAVATSTPRR